MSKDDEEEDGSQCAKVNMMNTMEKLETSINNRRIKPLLPMNDLLNRREPVSVASKKNDNQVIFNKLQLIGPTKILGVTECILASGLDQKCPTERRRRWKFLFFMEKPAKVY